MISSRTCVFFFINSLDISGCCDVTMPVDESNEEVTEYLREKITRRPETTTINDEHRKPEFKIEPRG